jgi:hypothetical protein
MKRCPKCDFSFASFHHVCDFDGTDLVDDPVTLPVSPGVTALVAATQSPFLRLIKSPLFLAVLALAGLMSSALLIGYFDAASQPNSSAESQAARDSSSNSIVSLVPPVQAQAQPLAGVGTQAPSISRSEISKPKAAKDVSSTSERSVTASRSRARLRFSPSIRNHQNEIALQEPPTDKALQKESKESALQRDSKKNANRKESKVTATLKTTWNILKKPFKF